MSKNTTVAQKKNKVNNKNNKNKNRVSGCHSAVQ